MIDVSCYYVATINGGISPVSEGKIKRTFPGVPWTIMKNETFDEVWIGSILERINLNQPGRDSRLFQKMRMVLLYLLHQGFIQFCLI